jgi:signal transduction histidine kinase
MREAQQRVSFVNQVSHELKTPLTNIRMYTELLEQRIAGKDVKAEQYTGILLSESRRLGRMIHNVLSFGQQGRGALRLHRAMGELDEAVGEVLEHFRPAFERREMQVVFTPGSPGEVLFDRDALEQILGNLLGNAEKYAGEGAAVRVVTRRAQERVVLDVEDNGPGIPDKYREEIFKPFFRLDARLTQQASGAGIGLSIARDLARLHGGNLVLVPTEKGALFRVTLGVI